MSEDRARHRWIAPLAVAVLLGGLYVAIAPHTADLAAQTARADVFRRSGYVPYWTGWFGGTPMAGYSLVTPPLLGIYGPVWLGALTIVAAGAVAVPLLGGCRRPRAAAIAVAVSGAFDVFSGRTTFAAGVVVGLVAMLAVERRRSGWAFALAALTTATSPVAGVLLSVVAAATVLAGPRRRRAGFAAVVGIAVALVVIAILASGSRGGYEPFTHTSLLLSVGTTLVVMLSPVGRRLRVIGWLTLWLLAGCFLIHSPVGANATRIAVLGAAPALIAAARWPKLLLAPAVVVASLLAIGQLSNDMAAAGGAVASKAYVAPLKGELLIQPDIYQHRVEVVAPKTHWPLTYLLPEVAVARGWERQTDEARNKIFYGRQQLTPVAYRAFLDRNAVGYVAAVIGGLVSFDAVKAADWVGLPDFAHPTMTWSVVPMFLPVVLVLIAENVGHVRSVAHLVDDASLNDRTGATLLSDGLATTLAGLGGGSATTTYGENIGVMTATRVFSTAAYWVAGIVAVLLSLSPKIGALLNTIPAGVLGGVTIALYGLIGLIGVKIWIDNQVDFGRPVNQYPAAAALIIGIGDLTLHAGRLTFTGIALGTLAAIVLHHGMRALEKR